MLPIRKKELILEFADTHKEPITETKIDTTGYLIRNVLNLFAVVYANWNNCGFRREQREKKIYKNSRGYFIKLRNRRIYINEYKKEV